MPLAKCEHLEVDTGSLAMKKEMNWVQLLTLSTQGQSRAYEGFLLIGLRLTVFPTKLPAKGACFVSFNM